MRDLKSAILAALVSASWTSVSYSQAPADESAPVAADESSTAAMPPADEAAATEAAPPAESAESAEAAPEAAAAEASPESSPESSTQATAETPVTGEAATVDTIPVPQAAAAAPQAPAEEGSGGPARLEDVVVTATKRSQSVRDIPQSITAYTGEKLENSGKMNLNDFIQETPGVTAAQGGPGFTRMTFRGISTDTNPYAGNSQPAGVFIGDTPFTDPYIANIVPDLSAFDLADVEVLKGPQGTLFGGAALSGAIRYQLQEPELGEWHARGFAQYSKPNEGTSAFTEGVAVNAPLYEDNLALRANFIHRQYPGVTDNLRTGQKDVDKSSGDQVRAQLLWKPENWKIKLTHLTQDLDAPDQLLHSDSPNGPRATSQTLLPLPSKNEFGMDSLEVGYDFDSMRVVSLSSRVHRDATFNDDLTYSLVGKPPAIYPATAAALTTVVDNSKNFSQELRLQSNGDGPFNWLVGAYFFDYSMYFNILIDTPLNQSLLGPGSILGTNPLLLAALHLAGLNDAAIGQETALLDGTSNAKSQEKALFTDLSYTWDDLTLSAGGRLYETSVTGGFVGTGVLVRAENMGQDSDTTSTLKEHGFNPKLSATYKFSKDMSLFALAAKGFRFGGMQDVPATPVNGVPKTYKSDTLWDFEVGLRTDWLDRTLRADVTAFYNLYKNPIVTQSTQGVPIAYNTNVSAAISQGFEGSLLWNTPIDGLTWSVAGGYTDAHITKPFTASDGEEIQPGQQMPGAAKQQFNTNLQYVQFLSAFMLSPNVSYTYIGKGYADLSHKVPINGYGSLSAGVLLGVVGIPGSPKLAVNLSNITDVTRATAGATGTSVVTRQQDSVYLLNAPRTITARLSVDF